MVTLEGGISKTEYKNAVNNLFKSNARLALKSLFQNSKPVDNSFFSNDDIRELQQAIFNREWDLKNRQLYNIDNRAREISYENYRPLMVGGRYVGMAPFLTNDMTIRVNNIPENKNNYNMQTSIGSAKYTIDPKGNVTLTDRYDINKGTNMRNPVANLAHTAVKLWGKPFDINLNLGNINDWNMEYTGNSGYDYR